MNDPGTPGPAATVSWTRGAYRRRYCSAALNARVSLAGDVDGSLCRHGGGYAPGGGVPASCSFAEGLTRRRNFSVSRGGTSAQSAADRRWLERHFEPDGDYA
jgi:hypothetical protein